MRTRLFVGLAVIASIACGCSSPDAGSPDSGTTAPPTSSSGAPTTPSAPVSTSTEPVSGTPSCNDSAVVQAAVASLPQFYGGRWRVADQGDPCATLSWVVAYPDGATGSSPVTVLFFHDGAYLGTATQESYAFTSVAEQTDDTVTVAYKWLRPGEPTAGVSGGPALIRYQWNGSSVDMLDQLPTEVTNPPGSNPAPNPGTSPAPSPAPDGTCVDGSSLSSALATLPAYEGRSWIESSSASPCLTLTWYLARPESRNQGDDPQYLLFFHNGQYLGTANDVPYSYMSVADGQGDSVTIAYGWRVPGDDVFSPGGGPATVRYQWNGSSVDSIGTLPPEVTG